MTHFAMGMSRWGYNNVMKVHCILYGFRAVAMYSPLWQSIDMALVGRNTSEIFIKITLQ